MRRAAAVFAIGLAMPALSFGQPGGGTSARPITLLDVPYVSQDERLCGGAAAAMMIRAAGLRGVHAADFAPLVDERAGGIHTRDLESALRDRGYLVRAGTGSADIMRQRIAAGRPVLALIEDRPGRYHYVVIVGWQGGAVVYHDPARAPFVGRREAEFERAWSRAGRWMLRLEVPESMRDAARSPGAGAAQGPLSAAAREFVNRNYREAARLAGEAVRRDPGDGESWRLLGASRYLLGDVRGALDAWNRAGGPTVDLVRLDGLAGTPHRTVERLAGLTPGTRLTRGALVRAERRISLLPSRQASRLGYVALPGNLAEVRGTVLERERVPSRLHWIGEAARLPIDREVGASFANMGSAGDRLSASWRFWERRPRIAAEFALPSASAPGVWSLSAAWQQEHYASAPVEERRDARVGWTNWVSARVRLGAGAGVARSRGTTQALLDTSIELRPLHDAFAVDVAVLAAPGGRRFGSVASALRWRHDTGVVRLIGNAAASAVSDLAPLDRWPGADSGSARPLLLRAHPLVEDGIITGPLFGRTVAQGTIEAERGVFTRGLITAGVAAFADVARAWRRTDGSATPLHVDVGVGLRVRVAPGYPTLRVDLARGLRDGNVALSAGWSVGS